MNSGIFIVRSTSEINFMVSPHSIKVPRWEKKNYMCVCVYMSVCVCIQYMCIYLCVSYTCLWMLFDHPDKFPDANSVKCCV